MAKFKEMIKARELRHDGESIREIAKKLGISKSTVSRWCSDMSLTEEQILFLAKRHEDKAYIGRLHAAEGRRSERLMRMKSFGYKGRVKVGKVSDRDLFMLGIGLYWAEGGKKNRETRFINSDPMMIMVWLKWLFRFAGVKIEDLILRIGINQAHKIRIKKVTDYWSSVTEVPDTQFRSPSFKKIDNHKVYANFDDHYGSLMVSVRRSTNLNYEILGMIEAVGSFEAKHGKI